MTKSEKKKLEQARDLVEEVWSIVGERRDNEESKDSPNEGRLDKYNEEYDALEETMNGLEELIGM